MADSITPQHVLQGYCQGLFPMGHRGAIQWHSPDPRGVFDLDAIHIPQTLRKTIRKGVFEVRISTAFEEVIDACGERREDGTWITPRIRRLYVDLFEAGYAHSVETWKAGELAGGLYGIAIGAAFFGESMFHRVTDASKVALAALFERLRARDYRLLDTQWVTPHLAQFGAIEIERDEYMKRLHAAIRLPRSFSDDCSATWVEPGEEAE